MVETISKIQQLLAESKFVEAQKEAEVLLEGLKGQENADLLELYFEALKAQSRPVPHDLIFLLLEKILPVQVDKAKSWVNELSKESCVDQQRLLLFEIQIAEIKGLTEELYHLITKYQIMRIEAGKPSVQDLILKLSQKYFATDFQIQLQRLAMSLLLADITTAERLVIDLILSCFERTSLKGSKDRLKSLYEVLNNSDRIYHLEIYKNFCFIIVNGVNSKKDYKKIIELVIYVENFKLQVLLLNTLKTLGLEDVLSDYALVVKQNKEYSYVYFDKYFPSLKPLFFRKQVAKERSEEQVSELSEMKSPKKMIVQWPEDEVPEVTEEEVLLAQVLKHQSFSSLELLDIAVSFLQSDFYLAARHASEMAYELAADESEKLKSCYLKVICLLKLGDYRSAVDISFQALSISKTQNDVLSFLYSQAEAYLKLKEYRNAKMILKKILSIDSGYRLAKERLEKLNAL